MSKIYLIRHGQASLGKANYDELSQQGKQQAQILGQHFKALAIEPDLIITGGMKRHHQTADGIMSSFDQPLNAVRIENADWNEFDFEKLIRAYLSQLGPEAPKPKSPSEFFSALRQALLAWSENTIETQLPETWSGFSERILSALIDVRNREEKNIFVVSSGGAISMALKHLMQFPNSVMVDLNLQSRNTGVTELFSKNGQCYVASVNHIAHLSSPAHAALITHA